MKLIVQCFLMALKCYFLLDLYAVQSTSIKENKHCSLDHEVHFENLYTRLILDGRSQRRQDPSSILNYLIPMKGPKRSPKYNPTIGYEPYWPLGEWVFSHAPNLTTKGVSNEQCGQICPEMFKKYGLICGRDRNGRYKSFENYCVMMNEDCTQRTDWLIAYKGVCLGELKTYPTSRLPIGPRAATYISNFFALHTTTPLLNEEFFNQFRTTKQ